MVMSSLLVAKAHDGRQRKPRGDAYHHLGAGDHRCASVDPCTAGLQSERGIDAPGPHYVRLGGRDRRWTRRDMYDWLESARV